MSSSSDSFSSLPAKEKKRQMRKAAAASAAAQQQQRAATPATVASAPGVASAVARTNSTPEMDASAAGVAADPPSEPEQHVDGDMVESAMRALKGSRPDLLRTSTYYEGAKGVYMCLADLPILNSIAPTVESMTESLVNMTPLKPSPEEQAEQKSIAVLDKRICNALAYADEAVDAKKDETIEGIVSAKKAVSTLGPVQAVVGAACNVGDGVGKAYDSANGTIGNVWQQVFSTVAGAYTGVRTMAGDTINNVTKTAGGAVNHVTTTTGNVVDSAKSTAGSTVEGVKSFAGSTSDFIGSNLNKATSSVISLASAVISYPFDLFQSITGAKKGELAPEK